MGRIRACAQLRPERHSVQGEAVLVIVLGLDFSGSITSKHDYAHDNSYHYWSGFSKG